MGPSVTMMQENECHKNLTNQKGNTPVNGYEITTCKHRNILYNKQMRDIVYFVYTRARQLHLDGVGATRKSLTQFGLLLPLVIIR